jgi:hypothetical protein
MAGTLAQTVAGTKIYISATLPTTQDANVSTGFPSIVSWSAIGEVTDQGEHGAVYDLVTHQPVADRRKYKFRGGYDNGSKSIKFGKVTLAGSDAGQTLLKTAAGSDADFSYKIVYQDGTKEYFQAKCMGIKTMVGTLNNILGGSADLQITSDLIETL